MKHHDYNLEQALVDLFPEIGLNISKLQEGQGIFNLLIYLL